MKRFLFACTVIALVFSAKLAAAPSFYCFYAPYPFDYDIVNQNSYSTGTVDAWNATSVNSVQYYFWTVSPAPGSRYVSYNGYNIPIDIYKYAVFPLQEVKSGAGSGLTNNDVIYGSFAKKATGWNEHTFYVMPTSYPLVPAGTYTGSLTFNFYNGKPGSNRALAGHYAIPMEIDVQPQANLSIVVPTGSFDKNATSYIMDFGELTPGASQSADILVKSNASYNLSVNVPSGGKMNQSPAVDTSIPYTFSFNGVVQDISGGNIDLVDNAPWTASGEARYSVVIKIGNFDSVQPGTYRDSLTLTITTN